MIALQSCWNANLELGSLTFGFNVHIGYQVAIGNQIQDTTNDRRCTLIYENHKQIQRPQN